MPATIRLRTKKFRMIASLKGWRTDDAIAKALRLNPATVSRNLRSAEDPRGTAPGERFIAAVLAALPEVPFEELFDVVGDVEDELPQAEADSAPPPRALAATGRGRP